MLLRLRVLAVVLAFAAATLAVGDAGAVPTMSDAEYARFVALVGDRLDAAVRALRPGDAVAGQLLLEATKTLVDHRFPGFVAVAALGDLHLGEAQLEAFVAAHPERVRVDTDKLLARMGAAWRTWNAAHPEPAPPPQAPIVDVAAAERAAARAHRPLLLVYEAAWCLPCKEVRRTLDDPRVRAALAGVTVAFVDQTEDDAPGARAAKARHHAETLPLLVLVRDGRERLRIDHVVDPEQLLAALAPALR
jgi:hypothetical protein